MVVILAVYYFVRIMIKSFYTGNKKRYIFSVFNLMEVKFYYFSMAVVGVNGFMIGWIISFTYKAIDS